MHRQTNDLGIDDGDGHHVKHGYLCRVGAELLDFLESIEENMERFFDNPLESYIQGFVSGCFQLY